MVLPGLAFSVIWAQDNPGIALAADKVFPHMVTSLLPVGVIGLVRPHRGDHEQHRLHPQQAPRHHLGLHQAIQAQPERGRCPQIWPRLEVRDHSGVGALGTQIAQFDGLFKYIQEMLAYMVPPVTVLFLLGVFWKAGTPKDWRRSSADTPWLCSCSWGQGFLSGGEPLWGAPIHFTLVAGIVFAPHLRHDRELGRDQVGGGARAADGSSGTARPAWTQGLSAPVRLPAGTDGRGRWHVLVSL